MSYWNKVGFFLPIYKYLVANMTETSRLDLIGINFFCATGHVGITAKSQGTSRLWIITTY